MDAPQTFNDGLPLPKVLSWDLDYTLWPFWCDTHVSPPLKAKDDGKMAVDSNGESFKFYSEVSAILAAAHARSIPMAIASRTHASDIAQSLLKLLHVPLASNDQGPTSVKALDLFAHNMRQIYPGDKRTHLKRISKAANVPLDEILFFDDESRNKNVETLGVCFHLVRDGVTMAEVDKGVREWRKRRQATEQ